MITGRPRILDLFCGGGGAATGYYRAGFDVVGVDSRPQKRYPFTFVQADALEYAREHGHEFDAIHASPPCQAYSALKHMTTREHPQLIEPVRAMLQSSGLPYVIENVPGAPLRCPLVLCGTMFRLETSCGAQLRRHRLFESNVLLMSPGSCQHADRTIGVVGHAYRDEAARYAERKARVIAVYGDHPHDPATYRAAKRFRPKVISISGNTAENPASANHGRVITVTGSTPQQNTVRNKLRETFSVDEARRAMGIDWLTMKELSQAIPPAYTEWIGWQRVATLDMDPMPVRFVAKEATA